MTQFKFVKTSVVDKNLPHSDSVPGDIFEIRKFDILIGWVGKNNNNEWVCWNSRGDFWISFGVSRVSAATKMAVACWNEFSH